MIPCFPYRAAPSLPLLLTTAALLAACIDPKSIGEETDGDESSSGDPGTGDATDGMTSQGPTTTSSTDPTASTVGETGESCPPIDPGPCTECECILGQWSCEVVGCVQSCEGEACGEACALCPDDDPDCEFPIDQGVCTATGECVGVPPPKLGFCEGALQPGFELELDTASGCGDLWVYARDMADERAVVLWVDQGLVADAVAMDMPVHAELSATDPTVSLEGRAGFAVTAAECTDVIIDEPHFDETWLPNAGTVIVDVVPTGDGFANATVELVDVELQRLQPGPAPIVFSYTFTDVYVGWLAG